MHIMREHHPFTCAENRPQMDNKETQIITSECRGNMNKAYIHGYDPRENIRLQDQFEQGIKDLYRTAETDGVFCYTFFKGIGYK